MNDVFFNSLEGNDFERWVLNVVIENHVQNYKISEDSAWAVLFKCGIAFGSSSSSKLSNGTLKRVKNI